jgi:hypothetical protein
MARSIIYSKDPVQSFTISSEQKQLGTHIEYSPYDFRSVLSSLSLLRAVVCSRKRNYETCMIM